MLLLYPRRLYSSGLIYSLTNCIWSLTWSCSISIPICCEFSISGGAWRRRRRRCLLFSCSVSPVPRLHHHVGCRSKSLSDFLSPIRYLLSRPLILTWIRESIKAEVLGLLSH